MRRNTIGLLSTIAFASATLYLSGCAYGPTSTKSLPGGTSLSAASNAASGPLLGTWWDVSQKGLRTLYGVVGSAHQGPPSFNDGTYSGASTCMRKSIALLKQSSGSLVFVVLPDGAPVVIAGNINPGALTVFSPACTAALVYTAGSTNALLVENLLSNPTGTSVHLSTGTFSAAVADSGSVLMALPAANGGTTVQLLTNGTNSAQPIATLSSFGGMTFLPGIDTALVADATANVVSRASYSSGSLSLTAIANASSGIARPLAIASSYDGRYAAVLNQQDSSVVRLDLEAQSPPIKTICRCSPTRLEPLAGNLAFRINEPGAGTVWGFDGASAEPRVLFLPSDLNAGTAAISTAKAVRQ